MGDEWERRIGRAMHLAGKDEAVESSALSILTIHRRMPAGRRAEHAVVLPGLVDTHVRVDESGRTTPEGFERTTRAAASGGVTTIVAVTCGDELPDRAGRVRPSRATHMAHMG